MPTAFLFARVSAFIDSRQTKLMSSNMKEETKRYGELIKRIQAYVNILKHVKMLPLWPSAAFTRLLAQFCL